MQLSVNLASWGLPPGTLLPVTVAGANSMGEVQALAPILPGGIVNIFAPAASTVLLTGQLSGQQVVQVLQTLDDAVITPSNPSSGFNSNFLTVSTSSSADHSNTMVSLLRFQMPQSATSTALTAAILELTVAQAPSSKMVLTVYGSACNTFWNENTISWNTAGTFAVNGSFNPKQQITSPAQNFMYMDSTTVVAGHITVPPGTPQGTVLRIDVQEVRRRREGEAAAPAAGGRVVPSRLTARLALPVSLRRCCRCQRRAARSPLPPAASVLP